MKNKITFMAQLFRVTGCRSQLLTFLLNNKLITEEKLQAINLESVNLQIPQIVSLLETLSKEEKLQLLSYEWTILPVESLSLTLVTERDKFTATTN